MARLEGQVGDLTEVLLNYGCFAVMGRTYAGVYHKEKSDGLLVLRESLHLLGFRPDSSV